MGNMEEKIGKKRGREAENRRKEARNQILFYSYGK